MEKVSVIIVNYNGIKWLPKCLSSLTKQDYPNYEIIVVDNYSNDKSVEYISENFKSVKIIKNNENSGFAKGNNIGFKYSSGEYIILLNNDTCVPTDYISNFFGVFKNIPNCSIAQSKIVLLEDTKKLDSAGSFWTDYTMLYHVGFGKNQKDVKYNKPYQIFSAKGASMIIKSSVIEDIGLFDDSFWCYYEESDFCHRALNKGYLTYYYPNATCYHHMGATSKSFNSSYVFYHTTKNRIRSFIKNFGNRKLVTVLLVHLFLLFIYSLYLFFTLKFNYLHAVLKAILWNIVNIKDTCKLRELSLLSNHRLKEVTHNPKLSYFYYLVTNLSKFNE